MPTRVFTGETNILVSYKFVLPDGRQLSVAVAPLDVRTATEVLGNATVEHSLVVPLDPPGLSYAALRAFQPSPQYVTRLTGLQGWQAMLLSRLLPRLTLIPPADDLADICDAWYAEQASNTPV
jgi:hypothetical protein